MDIRKLQNILQQFADERDWNQFHSPKNLAMALSVEASELVEHFQWLTEEESAELSVDKQFAVGEELADILLYLVRIADRLDIDLNEATFNKIEVNRIKYPAEQVKGSSKKYTEYNQVPNV